MLYVRQENWVQNRRKARSRILGTSTKRQNPQPLSPLGVSEFNLDDDLLSHGETPHYHRRCIVSLLSSGWDQVVPMLYVRQEILCAVPLSRQGKSDM